MNTGDPAPPEGDRLLDVVVDMLENEGYDAVALRAVARRAQVSLATIYKRYATRDDLILAALQYWTQRHRYSGLVIQTPEPGASLHEAVMQLLRPIFEPWERHPRMLTVYFRARSSTQGQKLFRFGLDLVMPAAKQVWDGVDEEFVAEFNATLSSVIYGLLGRYSAGEIEVTDILPILDRTVYWLTRGYEADRSPGR